MVLYSKVCDIISNISELLEIQLLTDTTILQVQFLKLLFHIVQNGGLLSPLTVELLPYLSAFVLFLGVQPWYHTLFCGERQRTAVMCHHTCDSSKLAVLMLLALVL